MGCSWNQQEAWRWAVPEARKGNLLREVGTVSEVTVQSFHSLCPNIQIPRKRAPSGPCVCVLTCAQLLSCDPMDCSAPGSFLHGTSQARILEVSCHFLLQGIFPTQGLTLGLLWLLHWQVDSLPLSYLGSPSGLLLSICSFPLLEKRNLCFKMYFWLCRVFTATYRLSLVAVSSSYSHCGV